MENKERPLKDIEQRQSKFTVEPGDFTLTRPDGSIVTAEELKKLARPAPDKKKA